MKKRISNILLIAIFIIGLSLLLYPTLSDYYNSFHQSRVITDYTRNIAQMDNDEYDEIWESAIAYNETLKQKSDSLELSEEEWEIYSQQLNVGGDGVMGYLEIPVIDVKLPIRHGTDESVLRKSMGHIEGTSLPTGGAGTHCVLSGHRGLPSAKLLTDLDKLVVGDTFILTILEETLTYEVDQILIVEPHEIKDLKIDLDKDYCTLVTCTPYGINSHRMLVRGHRIENAVDDLGMRVTADGIQIEPIVVAPILAVPMLLILLIWIMIRYRKPRRKKSIEQVEK